MLQEPMAFKPPAHIEEGNATSSVSSKEPGCARNALVQFRGRKRYGSDA
jgi:hypothetical protein